MKLLQLALLVLLILALAVLPRAGDARPHFLPAPAFWEDF